MKRLICEMCGSSDLIKENGVFVCQNCGTKYSVEEAKKMMIEGSVKVSGTVKVDNSESLLKRADLFLSDRKWDKAQTYYEKALDANPENSNAYFGLVLCKYKCRTSEELKEVAENIDVTRDDNFVKALKFNDGDKNTAVYDLVQYMADSRETESTEKHISMIKKLADQADCISKNIFAAGENLFALKDNGTVLAAGNNRNGQCNVSDWKNIVKIASNGYHTVGLRDDGTVVAVGRNDSHQCDVENWKNIVDIAVWGNTTTIGIQCDGKVLCNNPGWYKDLTASYFYGKPYLYVNTIDGEVKQIQTYVHDIKLNVNGYEVKKIVYDSLVLMKDGTVRSNDSKQLTEKNILSISNSGTTWLKNDGSCLCFEDDDEETELREINNWHNIVQVVHNEQETNGEVEYGVGANGKLLVAVEEPWFSEDDEIADDYEEPWDLSRWNSLAALSLNENAIIGIKKDGHILVEPSHYSGFTSAMKNWKVFDDPDEYVKHIKAGQKRVRDTVTLSFEKEKQEKIVKAQRKIDDLKTQKEVIQKEISSLKGFFTGSRRKELNSRIAELDTTIQELTDEIDSYR